MFEFGDGEEYDFNPSETSKLASLFGSSMPEIPSVTDLMYTAPKQPSLPNFDEKDGHNDSKPNKQSTEVLMVKVVTLWKLDDKTYKSLGKHGLGLIGSTDSKTQELIAYKSKNVVILRAKITEKFLFFLQKDNFSSFYDNDSQNWLVKFENNDQTEFIEKIKTYGAKIIDSIKESASVKTKIHTDNVKPDLLPKPENLGTGDQESDTSEKRANILNRITKLGQQVVPRPLSTGSDPSDHEGEVTRSKKHRKPRKTSTEKSKASQQPLQMSTDETKSPVGHMSINELPANNLIAVPSVSTPHFPMWYAPQPDISNYLLSQNHELKQTLSTISSKLDALNIPKVCNDNSALTSKVKALELKSDNLHTVAENYKKKYSDLEVKYLELIDKDKNKLVESNFLVSNLEAQISTLKLHLEVANEELTELKKQTEELNKAQKRLKEYEETIEEQKTRLIELEKFYEQNKEVVKKNNAMNSLNVVVEDLNQRLKAYEDKFTKSELERENLRQKHDRKINNIGNIIKVYMNEMYQKILGNYNEEYSYSYDEIKSALADNMKATTFKLIGEITERIALEKETTD